MKHKRITLTLLLLLTVTGIAHAQSNNPSLRQELLDRMKEDQKIRLEMSDRAKITPAMIERLHEIDRANTAWMKQMVQKYGWLGKSIVGVDGADAAWLLMQHADLDRDFQKQCLKLIERAVQTKEASAQDFAYLTDRVLVGDGKPQIYGTQFQMVDGKYLPFPIEDETNVNKRRIAVGLMPLEEYIKISSELLKNTPKN